MDADEHTRRWREEHGVGLRGGGRPVDLWLRLVHVAAVPLARTRLSPDAVTATGLGCALLTVPAAGGSGRWPLIAAVLVALAGLADGLDGALAVLRGRRSRWGAVVDAAADRLGEAALGAALWALGAPPALAVAAVASGWHLEYLRERAASAGPRPPVVVTVAERPTRLVVVATACVGAGLLPAHAAAFGAVGAVAWTVLGVVGVVQLLAAWGRLPR